MLFTGPSGLPVLICDCCSQCQPGRRLGAGNGPVRRTRSCCVDWFTGVETRMMTCAPVQLAVGHRRVAFTP
ncbi:hypothetical protein [Arthrobacter sp. DR-2P]|nr:hypothetical protein [Arthrobacter sp. DR-2P]